MNVVVDMKKCIGSGMCTTIAERVFKLDEDGTLIVIKTEVVADELGPVRDAIACCPVEAITLLDRPT